MIPIRVREIDGGRTVEAVAKYRDTEYGLACTNHPIGRGTVIYAVKMTICALAQLDAAGISDKELNARYDTFLRDPGHADYQHIETDPAKYPHLRFTVVTS